MVCTDYIICYHKMSSGESAWECVCGEDAMQFRVSELYDSGLGSDDIMVFKRDDEIDSKPEQIEESESEVMNRILEILDKSLALAGFKILEGDRDTVYIRHSESDSDFAIKIEELIN